MNIIDRIGNKQIENVLGQRKLPEFAPGDTLRVDVKVIEGTRERIQAFEGVCIARKSKETKEKTKKKQDTSNKKEQSTRSSMCS